jgi:protoporphyrinogen/coproporphyrinogen III oxidase
VTPRVPALVIGGGISGLVCAYALRKRGIEAQVVEAAPRPGGVIRSQLLEGFLLELGPQSFSATPELRRLCSDLGLSEELVQAPPKAPRYVLLNGTLRKVPMNPAALLGSSMLSFRTKWNLARDVFGKSQPPGEDESVADFIRRKFGADLLDRLVGPFTSGVYAGDPERLSMRSAFPSVYEAEKSAGSVIRGMIRAAKTRKQPRERPTLLTFREGNETLIRALVANSGSTLCCGTRAIRVEHGGASESFHVTLRSNGEEKALETERLVLATPTDVTAELLANVNPAFGDALSGVQYAPVAIVSLGYRREDIGHSLQGFGFLVPRSAGLRVLGTVWNSSLFPKRAPQGYVLLTSFVGGATDPQAITLSPEGLFAAVHREIAPLLSIREKPVFSNVQIYPRALPQYNLGHAERLSKLEKLLSQTPGLQLVGNYLRGPAIGACVEHALAVAEVL